MRAQRAPGFCHPFGRGHHAPKRKEAAEGTQSVDPPGPVFPAGLSGRKRYTNEESRKAEISRRLLENREYDEADLLLRATRQVCIELEAKLDRAGYEHRTATCPSGESGGPGSGHRAPG